MKNYLIWMIFSTQEFLEHTHTRVSHNFEYPDMKNVKIFFFHASFMRKQKDKKIIYSEVCATKNTVIYSCSR